MLEQRGGKLGNGAQRGVDHLRTEGHADRHPWLQGVQTTTLETSTTSTPRSRVAVSRITSHSLGSPRSASSARTASADAHPTTRTDSPSTVSGPASHVGLREHR